MGVLLSRMFCLQLSNCFRITEEGMNRKHLLLEFVQVGSRVRQVSCSAPAAKNCLGCVNLSPTDVTNWADKTGGIVKASHRLIVFGTESPHIAALSKVMWARGMKVLVHRVGNVGRWKTVVINASARIPFRRRSHNFGEVWPIPVFPSMSLGID